MPELEKWDGTERRSHETVQYMQLQERLEKTDDLLLALRDSIRDHLNESTDIGPALKEIIVLWKGSKLAGTAIITIAAVIASLWAGVLWIRNNL